MIKTREEYEALKDTQYLYLVSDTWHEDLWGTLEALRNVARAAQELTYQPNGYEDWKPVLKAIDALPAWVLEE